MSLNEMKKQKKDNKKLFKKALKNKDYETMEICIEFIDKYDELYETMKYDKYKKDLKIDNHTLQILERRHERRLNIEKRFQTLEKRIEKLEELNFNIYEIYEKTLTKKLTKHINGYVEKRINQVRREIRQERQKAPVKRTKQTLKPSKKSPP